MGWISSSYFVCIKDFKPIDGIMYEISDVGTVSFSEASKSEENTDLSISGHVTR